MTDRPLTAGAAAVSSIEAPECAQLFMMSRELFNIVGLGDRNVILLDDGDEKRYDAFVAGRPGAREAVFEPLRAWIAARPHIDEVHCLGFSAGGPAAMLTGHYLRARTVWAFAPRTARRNVVKETQDGLARIVQRVTGKSLADLQQGLTDDDRDAIDAALTPAVVESHLRNLQDPDLLVDAEYLASVVTTLAPGNGVTEHRVYYVPLDAADRRVAHALQGCAGVTAVAVPPSATAAPEWPFSRWMPPIRWLCRNHLVLDLLRERGQLTSLFPPFRPAAARAPALPTRYQSP